MMKKPLPTINGVTPSCCWLPDGNWPSVLEFLVETFPHIDRAQWLARMGRGDVVNEAGRALTANSAYTPHTRIFYYRQLNHEPPIPVTEHIIFQNDHLLVVDKPHFLPVTPTGKFLQETLLVRLKKTTGIDTLAPIHRLDRATAGVLLISTHPPTRGAYQQLFQQHAVKKTYEAIAPIMARTVPFIYKSRLTKGEPFFTMKEIEGIPNSETRIDIKKISGQLAHYVLQPITGKQHQLRVHLASLGAPILHDTFYPNVQPEQADDYAKPLQLLAKSIAFIDPINQQAHYFESTQSLMTI